MAELESEILDEMRRRMVRSFLDMVILMELRKHPMSGNDIISLVHNEFHMLLSSGTIYSILYFMERKRLIKGEWIQRRRVYTLTEQGREKIKAFINAKSKILGLFLDLFIRE